VVFGARINREGKERVTALVRSKPWLKHVKLYQVVLDQQSFSSCDRGFALRRRRRERDTRAGLIDDEKNYEIETRRSNATCNSRLSCMVTQNSSKPSGIYGGIRSCDTRDPGIEIFIKRFISIRNSRQMTDAGVRFMGSLNRSRCVTI
jgi:hypothetical protein